MTKNVILTYVAAVAVLIAIGCAVFLAMDSDEIYDPDGDTHVTAITGAAVGTIGGSPAAEADGTGGAPVKEARGNEQLARGLNGERAQRSASLQSVAEPNTAATTRSTGFSRTAASPVPSAVSPPCSRGGCDQRDIGMLDLFSNSLGGHSAGFELQDTGTVEELLERGLALADASPVHLAVRGPTEADSVRCEWRGVARTPHQREEAIRFWLGLDDTEELPSAQEVERLFMEKLDQGNPV